ncbi:MAG TPA: response regulator transcription factor [Bacteroidales bacterium]|nr:response regulator transcription factor [Bacteroidales bacterium]HPS74122.1 response regulator transcription factor [Bacteroidales bacterium]
MENSDFRILLVDDESDIREFLGYNLTKEGYQVFKAKNGRKGLEKAKEVKPHLAILDIMMPEMDGIEACAEMRKIPELKDMIVLFLTARNEDFSQIASFDAGADDFITKPIKPKVFLSRIQALLRRSRLSEPEPSGKEQLTTACFTIDRSRYLVLKENREIVLPKKEFELLWYLASSPDRVFTRDEIFSSVWGDDVVVGDRTIDVHIRRIREKLETDCIKTIKGVGYKFETR